MFGLIFILLGVHQWWEGNSNPQIPVNYAYGISRRLSSLSVHRLLYMYIVHWRYRRIRFALQKIHSNITNFVYVHGLSDDVRFDSLTIAAQRGLSTLRTLFILSLLSAAKVECFTRTFRLADLIRASIQKFQL